MLNLLAADKDQWLEDNCKSLDPRLWEKAMIVLQTGVEEFLLYKKYSHILLIVDDSLVLIFCLYSNNIFLYRWQLCRSEQLIFSKKVKHFGAIIYVKLTWNSLMNNFISIIFVLTFEDFWKLTNFRKIFILVAIFSRGRIVLVSKIAGLCFLDGQSFRSVVFLQHMSQLRHLSVQISFCWFGYIFVLQWWNVALIFLDKNMV